MRVACQYFAKGLEAGLPMLQLRLLDTATLELLYITWQSLVAFSLIIMLRVDLGGGAKVKRFVESYVSGRSSQEAPNPFNSRFL